MHMYWAWEMHSAATPKSSWTIAAGTPGGRCGDWSKTSKTRPESGRSSLGAPSDDGF